MKKLEFSSKDFETQQYAYLFQLKEFARLAQEKFDEWFLNEILNAQIVYDFPHCSGWHNLNAYNNPKHRARLVMIEELKKEPCKHECTSPVFISADKAAYFCKYCKIELLPEWKVKE